MLFGKGACGCCLSCVWNELFLLIGAECIIYIVESRLLYMRLAKRHRLTVVFFTFVFRVFARLFGNLIKFLQFSGCDEVLLLFDVTQKQTLFFFAAAAWLNGKALIASFHCFKLFFSFFILYTLFTALLHSLQLPNPLFTKTTNAIFK